MRSMRSFNRRWIALTLILTCLFEVVSTQTFQYSRGWTNGKKRSSIGSVLIHDASDGQEVFGICQIQRLREIWGNRRLNPEFLPCEAIEKPEIDILERHRRKNDCDRNSILNSFPRQPN